jgi:regulatory protein
VSCIGGTNRLAGDRGDHQARRFVKRRASICRCSGLLTQSIISTIADRRVNAVAKVNEGEVDAALLERWALAYLGRYASSAENLRRVLLRKVRRRLRDDSEAIGQAAPLIDAVVERHRISGLIDDTVYAGQIAQSIYRRGQSLAKVRARLAAKGVDRAIATRALSALSAEAADPDLAAACVFARRQRLGAYRHRDIDPARELAAFARAGFSRRVADAVLACRDVEAVEALARDAMS